MNIRTGHKVAIYLLFSLSGFCALIYEVLWSKYLSLTFGTTIWAISIVTATFMAGLALGSWLLGRWSIDHETDLLRTYAWLEAAIAAAALLFSPTLGIIERLYVYWTHTLPALPWLTTAVHILFSALLLLPPAAFMGGTFPLMCRLFARRKCGGHIGRLYAMNTLGATLGAFASGYLLIPSLGLSLTGYLAVALNLALAAAAWLLSRRLAPSRSDGSRPVHPPREWTLQRPAHRPALIAIGLVGFFALAYEILWTRVFLLLLGNTVYAFALMLSAYLVGVSLGGALYARLVHPEINERRLFCFLTVLMGASVLATAPFYDRLALVFQWAHDVSGENWWYLSTLSFLIVFAVLGLPTILSGTLLPAAVAILDPGRRHTGEGVGLVVLHNTFGAVLGSLAAGFLLIPALGLLDSFRLLAAANLLLGAFLVIRFRIGAPLARTLPVPVLLLAAALLPDGWDPKLMNSGVYVYAPKYRSMGGMEEALRDEKILEVIEGRDTTVAVLENPDGRMRFFTVNGKTDGGTGRDMATQVLIGHLPLLAHPAPKDVLVIGLGTGITLRGLGAHPTERIDCVEISPEVVRAERHFHEANGNVLSDPRVRLFVQDGRNLLLTGGREYDVIVSEPSNPWQSGNANLFTLDFYRLAAARLKTGGIFCQWLGLYDITNENLRIATRTLMSVFPEVLVFHSGADLILLAADRPFAFDYKELGRRLALPELATALGGIGVRSAGDLMARHYLYDGAALKKFSGGEGNLNTDDRSFLEFSARYNLGERTLGEFQRENMAALVAARGKAWLPLENLGSTPAEVAAALRDIGDGFARAGMKAEADHFLGKAAELAAGSPPGPAGG